MEDIAAEIAKQAKPQADKAAQIVRGTAQGVKEQAEPTAKVCSASHLALHTWHAVTLFIHTSQLAVVFDELACSRS